jgi:hypothetical protein
VVLLQVVLAPHGLEGELHSLVSVHVAGPPIVVVPEYPVLQVHEYEVEVLAQVAFAPHMPGAVQRSTVEQLVGPPVTVAPNVPDGQLHSHEPAVLLHTASGPQSVLLHSFTSVQVAGLPVVLAPAKPAGQLQS